MNKTESIQLKLDKASWSGTKTKADPAMLGLGLCLSLTSCLLVIATQCGCDTNIYIVDPNEIPTVTLIYWAMICMRENK